MSTARRYVDRLTPRRQEIGSDAHVQPGIRAAQNIQSAVAIHFAGLKGSLKKNQGLAGKVRSSFSPWYSGPRDTIARR